MGVEADFGREELGIEHRPAARRSVQPSEVAEGEGSLIIYGGRGLGTLKRFWNAYAILRRRSNGRRCRAKSTLGSRGLPRRRGVLRRSGVGRERFHLVQLGWRF